MNNILQKILWTGQRQLFWAGLGATLGLLLLAIAIQLRSDVSELLGQNEDAKYIIVNKKVGGRKGFKPKDVEALQAQSFVKKIGKFNSNQFELSLESYALGFRTELFFESVPNDFMDVQPEGWDWTPADKIVPIVLSRDYLALYNFGFAPSQGLPQFTPESITGVSFTLVLRGKQKEREFRGRVAGFSDRINSILVPEAFLKWANNEFQEEGTKEKISRLIVGVDNPSNANLTTYLKENNYEVSNGQLGKMAGIITTLMQVIAGIGLIIFFLALLIFRLNFQLIIERAKGDITRLLEIGYREDDITKLISQKMLYWLIAILVIVLIIISVFKYFMATALVAQGYTLSKFISWKVLVLLLALCGVLYLANWGGIKRSVAV